MTTQKTTPAIELSEQISREISSAVQTAVERALKPHVERATVIGLRDSVEKTGRMLGEQIRRADLAERKLAIAEREIDRLLNETRELAHALDKSVRVDELALEAVESFAPLRACGNAIADFFNEGGTSAMLSPGAYLFDDDEEIPIVDRLNAALRSIKA